VKNPSVSRGVFYFLSLMSDKKAEEKNSQILIKH
jgi:hypothetical protein